MRGRGYLYPPHVSVLFLLLPRARSRPNAFLLLMPALDLSSSFLHGLRAAMLLATSSPPNKLAWLSKAICEETVRTRHCLAYQFKANLSNDNFTPVQFLACRTFFSSLPSSVCVPIVAFRPVNLITCMPMRSQPTWLR